MSCLGFSMLWGSFWLGVTCNEKRSMRTKGGGSLFLIGYLPGSLSLQPPQKIGYCIKCKLGISWCSAGNQGRDEQNSLLQMLIECDCSPPKSYIRTLKPILSLA